jgi:hypothetical protein
MHLRNLRGLAAADVLAELNVQPVKSCGAALRHSRIGDPSCGGSGHLTARLCAPPARLRASLHRLVVTKPLAVLRTCVANLRAHLADARVMPGAEQHEPGTRVADLSAGAQHPDVIGFRVLSTELEAVTGRLETGCLTALATIDTFVCSWIDLMGH